jgi:hypothetical protein
MQRQKEGKVRGESQPREVRQEKDSREHVSNARSLARIGLRPEGRLALRIQVLARRET